jgi:hypothetical protein
MLRHIKDIKSPIALASAKSAARREKRRRADEGGGSAANDRPSTAGGGGEGPHPQPMPGAGETGIGFALSIYPYTSERDDEFDVTVGDTFVILSKAKGWWVVHRDRVGANTTSGASSDPPNKAAWVPAGLSPPFSLGRLSVSLYKLMSLVPD